MHSMQLILALLCACIAVDEVASDKLEFVSIVFRHGDRSPIDTFPTDPYKEDSWPQGFGQLSLIGMKQEYYLGEVIRDRYIESGYMSSNYNHSQIYIRSTDFDRTLISAQCVLGGLYPPTPDQEFKPGLQWQPIPVHTVPVDDDVLLNAAYCERYNTITDENKNNLQYKNISLTYKNFMKELSKLTGEEFIDLDFVSFLRDTLMIEHINNMTMPPWFNTSLMETLTELATFNWNLMYNSDEKKQLTGGVWANKVLTDMNSKANDELNDLKMVLYSAHDTTVAAALNVFNLFDKILPPYCATFIIELYSNNGNYYVKFYYRNETMSPTLVELTQPECGQPCQLQKLNKIMEPYTLTQDEWTAQCDPPVSSVSFTKLGLLLFLVVFGFALLLCVVSLMIIVKCYRQLTKQKIYSQLDQDDNDLL